jgi:prepilin-type processing-associated H-X9-DG protein
MRAPLDTSWGLSVTYTGAQAFRHQRTTCVAYLDGHVAPAGTPCRGQLATPSNLLLLGYPENGFLSDDDRAYDPR